MFGFGWSAAMQSLKLKVLDAFRCAGSACSFTCCQAWEIEIEPQKRAEWVALEDSSFKQEMLASVEKRFSRGQERFLMREDANLKCVMLDETGLCKIHKRAEDMLPTVCKEYPRVVCSHGTRRVATAKLSCPEVIRLVLDSSSSDLFAREFDSPAGNPLGIGFVEQVGQLLQDPVMVILNERRYPLAVRVTAIAELLIGLALRAQQGGLGLGDVQALCSKPKQRLYDLNQKVKSRRLRPEPVAAGRFWRFVASSVMAPYAKDYLGEALLRSEFLQRASSAKGDLDFERLYEDVLALRGKVATQLGGAVDVIGEKYLMMKFFESGFPVAPVGGNFIASFMYCLYPWAVIRLGLGLLAQQSEVVTEQDVISLIARVERMLGHDDRIYRCLDQNEAALRLDLYYPCLIDV